MIEVFDQTLGKGYGTCSIEGTLAEGLHQLLTSQRVSALLAEHRAETGEISRNGSGGGGGGGGGSDGGDSGGGGRSGRSKPDSTMSNQRLYF